MIKAKHALLSPLFTGYTRCIGRILVGTGQYALCLSLGKARISRIF